MAATGFIEAVRLENSPGHRHPHIAKVRLTSGAVLTRSDVIFNIRYRGVTYYTYPNGVIGAKVIVRQCPDCGSGDYITTEPDWTDDNNLLELPRF